jgi:hypothetical protein
MKRLLAVALVAGVSAVPAAAAAGAPPLLAIAYHDQYGLDGYLVRYDARSLRRLPGPVVSLGSFQDGWSFSPDRRQLVLGFANPSCVGGETSLRFVDTSLMRALGDVPLLRNGSVEATTWTDAAHVLALVRASDCINDTGTLVYGVDAATRRVTSRTEVPGDVVGASPAGRKLTLLVAPRNRIGESSLVTVDASGKLARVRLAGVVAGVEAPRVAGGNSTPPHTAVPGLAVAGGDAFVVPAAGPVSEIGLATLRVTRHELCEVRSLAKGATGPLRTALWLGNGRLAVTGWNLGVAAGRVEATPAGLELVDTRTWGFRRVASDVSSVQLADSLLLTSTLRGGPLIAYSLGGAKRYRRSGASFWFEGTLGDRGRGYAALGRRVVSFDVRTGAVGEAVPFAGQLLLGNSVPFTAGGF